MLRFFAHRGLPQLGLDIGPRYLRLAILRRRGQRWQLLGLAEHGFETTICQRGQLGDLDLLANACRPLLRRYGITRGRLCTGLPAQAIARWRMTLPAGSPQHVRSAQVRADCLLRHGVAAEQGIIDYQLCEPVAPGASSVLVDAACAPAILVDDRRLLASALRLQPGPVTPQELQLTTLLRQGAAGPGAAILHLAPHATWLALNDSLQLLDWRPNQGCQQLLQVLAPWLQAPPAQLLLTGELAHLPSLAPALARYAGITPVVSGLPPSIRPAPALRALGNGLGTVSCAEPGANSGANLGANLTANLSAFHTAIALATATSGAAP